MGWKDAPVVEGQPKWASAPESGEPSQVLESPKFGGSTLPANAGLAKLGTSLAGLPVDTIENIINLTRAAQGTVAGAVGATDWMPPLLQGSVGGSQWLQERLRATGEPGLSPDNPTPRSELGTAQYDFVSRGGIIPGGAIPAAASVVAERALGPEWAAPAAMAPSAITAGWNAMRAPGRERLQAHNAVRDETWAEAQAAGYKVPPSHVNPTFLGNRAESLAGKAALNQQAAHENQIVTDNLARRAAGLQPGQRITEAALEKRAYDLAQPYRDVAALSPVAARALERLKDVRAEARLQWEHYERQRIPEAQREAKRLDGQAATLEQALERMAKTLGKPDLVPQLRQARQDIAKVHDVKRALNKADGHVDAADIGLAYDRGHLTGELATIGKFARAFEQSNRPASRNPTPGVSALEPNAAVGLGVAGGPGGWMAGGVPLAGPPIRGLLLSDIYQRSFARPNYRPFMEPESPLQSLGRTAIMENDLARR